MNSGSWRRYRMLKDIMGVLRRHKGCPPADHGRGYYSYRSLESVAQDEFLELKKEFSPYAFQGGAARLKSKITSEISGAFNNINVGLLGRSIGVGVGEKIHVTKAGRGRYNVWIRLSWYSKVWNGVYLRNTKAVGNRIILDAEPKRLPDREFDFFTVKYLELGKAVVVDGWAARSRRFPNVVTVAKGDIINAARKAVAGHIAETLNVLEAKP